MLFVCLFVCLFVNNSMFRSVCLSVRFVRRCRFAFENWECSVNVGINIITCAVAFNGVCECSCKDSVSRRY